MKTTSTRVALTQKPAILVPQDARPRQVQFVFDAANEVEADLLFMVDGKQKADGDREYDYCPAGQTSPIAFPLGPGQHVMGMASDAHLIVTVLVTYEG